MFSKDERVTGLRVTWEEVATAGGLEWNLVVQRKVEGLRANEWRTVHVSRWTGYMMDLVATATEDCASAFFFGEDRDLARACASNLKVARAHARRHERRL